MNSSSIKTNKLALGTVQFGLDYGVANQDGRITLEEGRKILAEANMAGVDTLDTAIAYGDSEATLGQIGVANWQIVSKLPRMPDDVSDVDGWVEAQILGSLSRLNVEQLDGVLLHYPAQIFSGQGRKLPIALQKCREIGLVKKIGASVYGPNELSDLLDVFDVDLIQSSLNIVDRRLIDAGWLERLTLAGVEVHVRSIFLQGLLLMAESERPGKFTQWQSLWVIWDSWLRRNNLTPLEACLRFALKVENVSKVVIGVDSLNQIKQILAVPSQRLPELPDFSGLYDERLINPSNWARL
jgi:aryl-alcohol dehydrogenase-like predicted oxidoreductase